MLKHDETFKFEFDGVIGSIDIEAEMYEELGEEGVKMAEYAKFVKKIGKAVADFEETMLGLYPFPEEDDD